MHRAGRARRLAAVRQPGESHDEDEQPEADDCEACPLRWLYLAVAKVAQLGRPGEIVALLHRFPLCAAVVAARRWCDVTHTTILVSFSMPRKPALVRRPHSGLLTNRQHPVQGLWRLRHAVIANPLKNPTPGQCTFRGDEREDRSDEGGIRSGRLPAIRLACLPARRPSGATQQRAVRAAGEVSRTPGCRRAGPQARGR